MEKETKLTLVGFMVGVLATLFVILIAIPTIMSLRSFGSSLVCGVNLKGLGTAMVVYANDYDDNFPQLPGNGPWSQNLGFPFYLEKPNFEEALSRTPRTITASWYLLVREADVSPKAFVCPNSPQTEFDGSNPKNSDIVTLWDFGYNPYEHVSYAYHNPYGNFPPDGLRSASFAVAADMNPWMLDGDFVIPDTNSLPPKIISLLDKGTWKFGNCYNHEKNDYHLGHGQNVLFADGHSSYETQPNVGANNDNIYTFWSTGENPTEQDIQGGTGPTSRSPENDAKSKEDSFLAI